jgi:hypothetical protein
MYKYLLHRAKKDLERGKEADECRLYSETVAAGGLPNQRSAQCDRTLPQGKDRTVWRTGRGTTLITLKVHKREIFYGSDFEFFTIS